jgi:hypothetical protein
MTPTQFLALIGLIKDETAPNGNTKTRIGDAILESSKQANTYSTDETVIGTWINGKPIYRKVFEINKTDLENGVYDVPEENSGRIRHDLSIELYLKTDCISGSLNSDVPTAFSLAAFAQIYNVSMAGTGLNYIDNYLNISSPIFDRLPDDFDLVLEYTKTTDSIPE